VLIAEWQLGEPLLEALGQPHRYHWHVFLTPSWAEIYVIDQERSRR